MSLDNQPWRNQSTQRPRPPKSSVPSKRSADTQEDAWVADEDRFVLQQAKKKAELRVKGGRARPIDWLAVTLRAIDPTRNPLDEEIPDSELDVVDPEGVFEGLDEAQLEELEKDIDTYIALETVRSNVDFWQTMKVICQDRRKGFTSGGPEGRGVSSVAADIDRLLSSKTYEGLETLEKQVRKKLQSGGPIDVDYWEHLLKSLQVWKAKAKLRKVSQSVIQSKLENLRKQQAEEAAVVCAKLASMVSSSFTGSPVDIKTSFDSTLDPEPLLKLRPEDKVLESVEEREFLQNVTAERQKVLKLGFVPPRHPTIAKLPTVLPSKPSNTGQAFSRFAAAGNEDFSQATRTLYEREVARGFNEDEEIFQGEEEVATTHKSQWADKYRPRKPRYFNRVQMGYEWNKYNQTHYDHDNPPPKVVQGYKFNIFYPDLIDRTKAPTYRIERENGRKRGQTSAPAGEEDTCLIRFMAGPPYEDIAFKIVDREWDYSAKRERGFKSSFDKGILQLHFQFKKVYYRK